VPELELFPKIFAAKTVRFSAGLELNLLNHLLSFCGLQSRAFGLDFTRHARIFLKGSLMLFPWGTTNAAPRTGAFPGVGLLSLGELLAHLHPLGIWCARGDSSGWSIRLGSSHETKP
jgi:hypothetical protein